MKAFFISFTKKTAYCFAAIIIIAAVLVCLSRILTPVLDQHREDFEKYASQQLQLPVTIKNVRVSWYQYQPVIDLNDVTILDKEKQGSLLKIQKISLLFSVPKSIWHLKPVASGILLVGTNINVYQTESGEFKIQGFTSLSHLNEQPNKSETTFAAVLGWLSQQPRLILQNIDLRYTPFQGPKRFITLFNFSVENTETEHSLLGKGLLHQKIPTEVTVSAQWEGQTLDLAAIKAKIYVYLSGLTLNQWISEKSWQGWQVTEGLVSAKVWATWQNGTFQQIQSSLQTYGLKLYSQTDKSTHLINRFSGDIGWKRQEQSQVFAGDNILIDLPSRLWPSSSFYISLAPDAKGVMVPKSAEVGYIDLDDIQSFLFASPPLWTDSMQKMLKELRLKGNLQNAAIVFGGNITDWNNISLNANFNQISFLPWQKMPGLRNLSGTLKWNRTNGLLKLNSTRVVFEDKSIFENEINVDQLSGDITWERDPANNWVFRIPTLQLLNDDAAFNVNGSLTIPPDKAPIADMNANFTMQKASHISRYLPMRTFDASLVTWLKEAFLSGEVKSGHAVLRGPLSDFPFDNNQGLFSMTGAVKNIDFRYAPDWPLLRNLSGELTFTGRKMVVDVDQAQILGIPITQVHGVIPYFGEAQPQILEVKSSDIKANLAQGINFIHESPLEKNLGKMFAGVDLRGPMTLTLGLTVPLKDPDKAKVQGDLAINEAEMNLIPWNLKLTHLNGQIQFTENSTQSKMIQGELFNKPLQFSLDTLQKTKKISVVQAQLTHQLNINDLEAWLNLPLSQVVRGSVDLKTSIDFSLTEPINIHVQSNLLGVEVNLPDEYGKKAKEARDFSADIVVQDKEPLRMKLSYGNLLSAAMMLERKQNKYNLMGANLHLGLGEVTWPPSKGIYITGKIDKLDWDKIKTYSASSHTNDTYFSPAMLRGLDIQVGELDLDGQRLTQINLKAASEQSDWNIIISSPAIVGQLKVPMKLDRQATIVAQFQKIKLNASSGLNQPNALINTKTLPSISFAAHDVNYNNMPLGSISFKAVPIASGLAIQHLHITSPRIDLRASGRWIREGTRDVTYLQGTAASPQVSDLLNSLGLEVHNFIASQGSLKFQLNWLGVPYAPSLSSMNGNASLSFGQGRIVDIGQENGATMTLGRMLSIFSLQTIPRRLTFDFSDVFQKGYSFDSIRGDFKIRNGDLFTTNLHFEGPVAGVGINGRIGLKDKDYNFILSVTAHVTSSLPLAATLITGNPLIGLGALAVNTMIGSKVSTYYYSVTGSWNNPIWKSVQSPKK